MVALPEGYKANAVRWALTAGLADLPPGLRRSLMWDRGREMAEHEQLATELGLQVYFCDPKSPWQRGSNENTVSIGDGPVGLIGQAGAGSSR